MRAHDGVDAALIRALQEDGRTSLRDLAAHLGVSRDAVSHRLRTLTEHGGLRVVAALDPGFAGHHVLTHVMVDADGRVAPIARAVAEQQDPVFVSMVSGPLPLVFESRHGTIAELHATLDAVRALDGVRRVRVTTYVEILKGFFVARHRRQVRLDPLDHEIIAILQRDGRTSYRAIADSVHLAPSSVRARAHRLIDAGVIRISALKVGGLGRDRLAIGMGITASGDTTGIRERILTEPSIDFAARTHGAYDFICTLVGGSSTTLLETIEDLRAIPQVSGLETWTHLDIVKEDYARRFGSVPPA